jgi:ketosteroid isomerase-like protein
VIAEPQRHVPIGGAMLAFAAVVLVGVIAALVISGRPEAQPIGPDLPAIASPAATIAPVESGVPATAPDVTTDEAQTLLDDYVAAYDAEDPAALSALLTPDAVRSSQGEDEVQGADAIATIYADQFAGLDAPSYTFRAVRFEPAAGEATLTGTYRIASDGAPAATGAISFHLLRVDGQLLIDRIAIIPD